MVSFAIRASRSPTGQRAEAVSSLEVSPKSHQLGVALARTRTEGVLAVEPVARLDGALFERRHVAHLDEADQRAEARNGLALVS